MDQIFLGAVRHLLDPPGKEPRREFNVEYATMAGDIIAGKVVCTSSSFHNDTFNFKFTESGEVRTAHAALLLTVNNKEVMI